MIAQAIATAAVAVSFGALVVQINFGASMHEGVHAGIYRWIRNISVAIAALLWTAAALVVLASAIAGD